MPGRLCVCVFAYISICGYLTAEGCVLSIRVSGEKFYAGFGVLSCSTLSILECIPNPQYPDSGCF